MAPKSMELGHLASTNFLGPFLRSQFFHKSRRPPADADFSRQVAIITGGSSGLGLHCASHFLSLKLSHLIVAVRCVDKGERVAQQLRTEYPSAKIEVWELEMSSYPSIQTFCQRVDKDLSRLDFTILNAGVMNAEFRKCSTGNEEVIQVNYLSTFLLAILMLPISKRKAVSGNPGRLTIVSSFTALIAKLPNRDKRPFLASFNDIAIQPWDATERYWASKMLGHLFFARLIDYIHADDVVINLVEPGMCKGSDLLRDSKGTAVGVFLELFKSFAGRKAEDGAWTYVDAAVIKGKESHGCFLMDNKNHAFTQLVYLPEGKPIIDTLWDETMAEFEFIRVRETLEACKRREYQ